MSDSDKAIIKHSRKTLLFHNNQSWEKKSGDPDFDVPMGCYNGAEVSELVGTFILNKLGNITDKNRIGLHLDDGLSVFDKLSRPQIEQRKKNIIRIFKDCGLSITVTSNITSLDFLDINLNLEIEYSQPFRKPNYDLVSIDVNSNQCASNIEATSKVY